MRHGRPPVIRSVCLPTSLQVCRHRALRSQCSVYAVRRPALMRRAVRHPASGFPDPAHLSDVYLRLDGELEQGACLCTGLPAATRSHAGPHIVPHIDCRRCCSADYERKRVVSAVARGSDADCFVPDGMSRCREPRLGVANSPKSSHLCRRTRNANGVVKPAVHDGCFPHDVGGVASLLKADSRCAEPSAGDRAGGSAPDRPSLETVQQAKLKHSFARSASDAKSMTMTLA